MRLDPWRIYARVFRLEGCGIYSLMGTYTAIQDNNGWRVIACFVVLRCDITKVNYYVADLKIAPRKKLFSSPPLFRGIFIQPFEREEVTVTDTVVTVHTNTLTKFRLHNFIV